MREKALGADHPDVTLSRQNLAETLLALGQVNEALRQAELAWARRQQDDIPVEPRATTAFLLARALMASPRSADTQTRAQTLAKQALELYEQAGDQAAGKPYEASIQEVERWLRAHGSTP